MTLHMMDLLQALQIAFIALPVIIVVGLAIGYYRGWRIWEEYLS